MSIKDLFNNKGVPKIQKSVTSDEMVATVESSDFVEAKRKQFDQFIPPIDFATASNFAKFGSAELYYEKAFERIHNYYPYDGTLAEKIEFENSSSYLDKYVFENLYPRTNGYLNFDASTYIDVFGGPHTASNGMTGKPLDSTFDHSMIYDESKKRTSAFEFRGEDGITAEFWLKVNDNIFAYTIFDISGSDGGQIKLERNVSNRFVLTFKSGSEDGTKTFSTTNVIPTENTWNHYAITVISSSSNLEYKLYRDGQYLSSITSSANIPSILPVVDGLHMRIGSSLSGTPRTLSGSIDEFRFWKSERTSEQIFNNWFIPLGGGTNKHDANIDLGLYFKFNEGITGTESLDSKVLDYSGRINNGTITGYNSSTRNTGSAITEKLGEPEFLDPIIYSTHPDVVSKKAEYMTSGSMSDLESTSMIFSYFPSWMQEEDEQTGSQLKYLSQVLGSYFDTLWHQIGFIDKIHGEYYVSGSNKPLPFAKKLLQDKGFVMPDVFVDATLIENLRQKDDNEVFEKEINEVRNTIYHNLYNNLNAIYKSKGTEKSFRNFFRSLGIGQDVVKLKMYADDSTFTLRNNYEYKSYERKFLNFNVDGQFDATIYQTSSANNSNIYLPGDKNYTGSFTAQSEIILPRKQKIDEPNFNPFLYLTSSIFGFHSTGSSDYDRPTTDYGLQAFVVHSDYENSLDPSDKQRIKFVLTGSGINLTSSWFDHQYENNKWSLAVRMKHSTYPRPNITGSSPDDYLVEFYGVEADGNTKRNSFLLTTASVAQSYYSSDKIFYAGAHRTNFSGSTLHYSDVKLGYVRYWHSYLSNDAIDQHAFDSETFGANEPFEQDLVNVYPVEIPREKTLAFHWAFNDLTGSDSSGQLLVSDLSSGSLNSDYGLLSDTIQRYVAARGEGFNTSSTKALDKDFLYSARKRLPDDLMSSDLTTIKTDETEQFFVDEDVSDNFYSFEKSMWGAVSDEMMNMFSTALDLNNLVGQPNQRYHHRYNLADFLRNKFFEDVENEPDLEKFTSFYKWIDDSISIALQQLVPASARFSEKINNIVESHVLERSKYVHQIPITTNFESTEGSIKGHAEMNYNWKFGHAPTDTSNEANHVLWQQDRKEKSGLRENLRNSKNNHSIQSSGLIRREIDGSARISDTYAVRKFAKTYEIGLASQETIHGGTNFGRKKNLQLFHESIAPAGRLGEISGTPQNVVTVGVGEGQGIVEEPVNNDLSPRKKKYQTEAQIGNRFGDEYGHNVHGDFVLPLNIMSGTVNSGYNATVESLYKSGVHLTNLHNDIVGNNNETSVQGPFTEQHVGGLQYRHIDINHGSDNEENRPEGWGLSIAEHPVDPEADGALGFLGADYEAPYPATTPKATRYREEHAKRPVNIKNIKTVSGSWKVGNYRNELELFSVSPTFQKTWAIEAYSDPSVNILPISISESLPDSTHYQTLFGFAGNVTGNVFGSGTNNRQFDGNLLTPEVAGQFAEGSFNVSGATVTGILASGSFNLTGSPIAASYATGSFEVTGANVQGTQAIGSFTMTSSWVPGSSPSNALFDVNGIDDANEGAVLVITQSIGSIFSYEIDLDNSLNDPGNTSISGSTDRNFYNDFRTALSTDLPDYTVNYVEHPVTRSIAVSSSAEGPSRLYSSDITAGGGGTAGYAISFWLYFDTFGDDRQKSIYEAKNSGSLNPVTKYIYIESGSLFFESYWRDQSGAGDEFVDTFVINNFTSSYSQSLNHFSFSHSGSMGDGDQLILYLNGVSSSALTVDSLSQHKTPSVTPGSKPWVDLETTEITLFTKDNGDNSLFTAGSTGPIYLDEVVVYPEARNHSDMVELYNGGKWQSSKPGSPTMIMDFESLTVGAAITHNQIISDAGSNNNNLTASISSAGDLVPLTGSGTSLTIVKTPSSASFTISGAPVGANYNLTLNLSGVLGTFTNVSNATGGVDNEGAVDTNTITIDGQTFTITHSSPAGALEILATGSAVTDDVMWAELETKIEANTGYTVVTGSDNPRTFNLTSILTGSAENPSISSSGATFTVIKAGTAGTDESGAEDGDQLTIASNNFLIDLTSGIGTGSTSDFHNALSQSIKDSTNFDTIVITDLGTGYHRFDLTSSVATPLDNVAITQNSNGSRATFQNLVGADGGVEAAGIEDGDTLEIENVTFHLSETFAADGPLDKYIETTGSSTQIWESLRSRIESTFTDYSVSVTDLSDQALFEITASTTGSSSNRALVETGNSFTSLVDVAGGTDETGIRDQDSIRFGGFTFVLTASAPSPTPSYSYIETTGTSEQIWQALETEIETNTSFNVSTSSAGSNILFSLTASATGSSYNESIRGAPDPSRSFFTLVDLSGGSDIAPATYGQDNIITIPRTDLTGSQRNIVTRFSAPGGPEVQSIGYLDAYTQTYSVHNSMPFRNLSVLGSGSGEEGTIRVEDHLGLRRGLRTLRGLHMGQFGIDSQYGEITSGVYPSSGSFNKQHRNTSDKYVWNGSSDITASLSEPELITDNNYDNAFINTSIPRSELQYSWIHNATSGAAGETYGAPVQRIVGYAPRDGIVSSSAGYVEAIVFPTASSIFGS